MAKAFELFSTSLVTLAAGLLLWTQLESRWPQPRSSSLPTAVSDVTGLTIDANRVRHTRGTGPVALVEFTDYECPFCQKHTRETFPLIRAKLLETGKIRHVVLNFPLERIHRGARKAAHAAECADQQGRYWEMHELLSTGTTLGEQPHLDGFAQGLKLNMAEFRSCMSGEAGGSIARDLVEGERLGVGSTPTFFIGVVQPDGSIQLAKRFVGARPFGDFEEAIATVSRMLP